MRFETVKNLMKLNYLKEKALLQTKLRKVKITRRNRQKMIQNSILKRLKRASMA